MTILDQARLHFKEEFFTARQFEKMTGVDFKIAAMNLTKRADEGKISKTSGNGNTYFYFSEKQLKVQPRYFNVLNTNIRIHSSPEVSVDGSHRYIINPKTPNTTTALNYFEAHPEKYIASKEKIIFKCL